MGAEGEVWVAEFGMAIVIEWLGPANPARSAFERLSLAYSSQIEAELREAFPSSWAPSTVAKS